MRFHSVFHSTLTLLFVLFLVIGGAALAVMPWAHHMREAWGATLERSPLLWTSLGFCVSGLGITLFILSLVMNRRTIYHLQMGGLALDISDQVIEDYVVSYWSQHFPRADVPTRAAVTRRGIELIVDFPGLPLDKQEELLEASERDLSELFRSKFGYEGDFYLTASFPEELTQR